MTTVKGSTPMAEHLAPEDVLEIMNGAFDFLIEPISRYEGALARLMGDGILAFIGAPIAHEDDAERTSNARHVATLAGLKASGTCHTTSSEDHNTATGHMPAPCT